ncbi:SET domain-containing protein [Mycena kentingensis (nom. inval.)]|nr:SET domain-containing protein [Mycena kentingensis (nom. inval.)]
MPGASEFKLAHYHSTSRKTNNKGSPSPLTSVQSVAYVPRTTVPSPPLQLCVKLNAEVRSNPVLGAPYFDFAGHTNVRAYCMSNVLYSDHGDDHTAALLDVGVQKLLPSPPLAPPAASRPVIGQSAFVIRNTESNGRGMFAAEPLQAGFTILVERPAIITPYIIANGGGLYAQTEADILHALVGRLPAEKQGRVLTLASCRSINECEILTDIARTNALPITLAVPTNVPHPELPSHRAIFLNTSRCNHSCSPNARWHWDLATFSLTLVAVRPIAENEEITISYLPGPYLLLPRATRDSLLRSSYNFSCRCAACVHTKPEQSDMARAELSRPLNVATFEEWIADQQQLFPDTLLINVHRTRMRLLEVEGLEGLCESESGGESSAVDGALPLTRYTEHLDGLAMAYGALGDISNFRKFAWLARESRPMSDEGAAKVMQRWTTDVHTFPVWGWRARPIVGTTAIKRSATA